MRTKRYVHLPVIRLLLAVSLVGVIPVTYGQDTARIVIKPRHVIAPVSLTVAGLATQGKISRQVQRALTRRYPGFRTTADDYLGFVPAAVNLGLSASGVKGKHGLGEQVLLTLISNVISQGVSQGLKLLIDYQRPDKDGFDSFPSGHTTFAFTNASLLHEEYGHRSVWYSVGGYGTAAAVGGMRMLNNRHWVSDVLVGAGIGIGSTKAVYLTYPWAKQKVTRKARR